MGSNFLFLDDSAPFKLLQDEIAKNHDLWQIVSTMEDVDGDHNPEGFLPLVMGVKEEGKRIKDSNKVRPTEAFSKFPVLFNALLLYGVDSFARAAFFRLPPKQNVLSHIDDGSYYLNKDRFHLCIQGTYEYAVDKEVHIIKQGQFFWFDNKKIHRAKNIGEDDRITFVFDVPYEHSPIRDKEGKLIDNR